MWLHVGAGALWVNGMNFINDSTSHDTYGSSIGTYHPYLLAAATAMNDTVLYVVSSLRPCKTACAIPLWCTTSTSLGLLPLHFRSQSSSHGQVHIYDWGRVWWRDTASWYYYMHAYYSINWKTGEVLNRTTSMESSQAPTGHIHLWFLPHRREKGVPHSKLRVPRLPPASLAPLPLVVQHPYQGICSSILF